MHIDKDILALRAKVLAAIRSYFAAQNVTEVDVPQLVANPDLEPTIEPFQTKLHQQQQLNGFLIPSPEFQMKQLLAAGSGDIYWLGHVFRNDEPASSRHNPEFTMLEWYRLDYDYIDLMTDTENLIKHVVQQVGVELPVDVSAEWEKLSVIEAFQKYAGISEEQLFDKRLLKEAAVAKGYSVDDSTTYDDIFYQIMLQEIESHLGKDKPTFLYDYPRSQAALAKISDQDDRVAERFELYINGLELTNAFSELSNWQEQQQRLEEQRKIRQENGQPIWDVDQDFIDALKKGLPKCAGISLGVDRLIMLLSGKESIEQVLLFPASQLFDL